MNESWLPPDLDALEGALSRRPKIEPPALLRARVLAGVTSALRRQQVERRWTFAAQVAAAVLVWINLSWALSRDTSFDWEVRRDRTQVSELAAELQDVAPSLSPDDARRLAIVWR